MDMTIFSKSIGVMCFSRPRLRCSEESLLVSSGRTVGEASDDTSSSESDSLEETLLDNAGIDACAMCLARGTREHLAESGERGGWVSGQQQKVLGCRQQKGHLQKEDEEEKNKRPTLDSRAAN